MLFAGAGAALGSTPLGSWGVALGLMAGAVATWFAGVHLNRKGPQVKLAQWRGQRRQQLDHLVETGQFSLGPGQPQPRSVEEARAWSQELFAAEERENTRSLEDRHTLFWLPMQYFAFVWGALAVVVLVLAIIGR